MKTKTKTPIHLLLLVLATILSCCAAAPAEGFAPLQCNIDASIDSDDCLENAINLSSIVSEDESAPLTIPCGMCVIVDYTDDQTITIPGGLNVIGRLHFPPTASLNLRTTAVFVQGMWSMLAPDDGNKVKISLFGFEEQTLHPHGNNCCQALDDGFYSYDCNACIDNPEALGIKPFAVVGGQLDIRVVDESCASWSKIKDVNVDTMQSLMVDPAMAKCLRPGDEIVVTADGRAHDSHELFTVDSADETTGEVVIQEIMNRVPPSQARLDEPRLAIEVALLRRDVVFHSEEDEDPDLHYLGAHLIVFVTPDVVQTIQGVRFENSGQEGVLGRYPIHFHLCGDTRSLVSKNVIYDSNQRCVFIHNTNTVTIDDNVAFKTRGHCYATETGDEVGNTFSNNLASYTKNLRRDNGQSDSPEDEVSCHGCEASSFWFRNLENDFINNVAAGGTKRGFWLELKDKYQSQLHPESLANNTAHSYETQGLMTYKRGWQPSVPNYFPNFVSFNNQEGAKFHINGDVTFDNALFADNNIGIRYGAWNQGTKFQNSLFMLSEVAKHRNMMTCTFNNKPWFHKNIILENVIIRNFATSTTFKFYDHNLMENTMGDPVHATNITLENCDEYSKPKLEECGPKYQNFFMEDSGGTLSPEGMGPAFLIHDGDREKAFLPEGSCTPSLYSKEGCAAWCEGVCLRLVRVTPYGGEYDVADFKMLELTEATSGKSYEYSLNEEREAYLLLPAGQYIGEFLDDSGDPMVGYHAMVDAFAEPQCNDFVTAEDFSFPNTLPPTSAPTTSAPTVSPTIEPTRFFDKSFVEAGEDKKCPVENRFFKKDKIQSVEECHALCFDIPGCNFFSWGWEHGKTCMGCSLGDAIELESHDGFNSYKLTSMKDPSDFNFDLWNGLDGVDTKCPYGGDDRIGKEEGLTKRQCYQLCLDTPNCKYFSFGEDFAPSKGDRGDCLLCQSDENFEGHTGYFTYDMDPGTWPPSTAPPTAAPTASPTIKPTKAPTVSPTPSPTRAPTVRPTPAPTGSPTIEPTRFFDKSYVEAGEDEKCPSGKRFFKVEEIESVDHCHALCFDIPGCNFFTYSESRNKMCMGCTLDDASELDGHSGFDSYELTSIKDPSDFNFDLWNGLDGVDTKCPYGGDDRIGKENDLTKRQCYQLCKDTPDCRFFSFGEDFAPSSNDRGICLLCQSDENLEGHKGYLTYEMI